MTFFRFALSLVSRVLFFRQHLSRMRIAAHLKRRNQTRVFVGRLTRRFWATRLATHLGLPTATPCVVASPTQRDFSPVSPLSGTPYSFCGTFPHDLLPNHGAAVSRKCAFAGSSDFPHPAERDVLPLERAVDL